MSGRPDVVSTSVNAAHPLDEVGLMAPAGINIVCLPAVRDSIMLLVTLVTLMGVLHEFLFYYHSVPAKMYQHPRQTCQ